MVFVALRKSGPGSSPPTHSPDYQAGPGTGGKQRRINTAGENQTVTAKLAGELAIIYLTQAIAGRNPEK